MFAAFELLGHKPEHLRPVVADVAFSAEGLAALDALRKKGFVWRSERSVYLLEDPAVAEVLKLARTP